MLRSRDLEQLGGGIENPCIHEWDLWKETQQL